MKAMYDITDSDLVGTSWFYEDSGNKSILYFGENGKMTFGKAFHDGVLDYKAEHDKETNTVILRKSNPEVRIWQISLNEDSMTVKIDGKMYDLKRRK